MNSLEFAINMELDGGKYYREQAEKNKGNSLRTVFLMLAKEEDKHVEVLQNRQSKLEHTVMKSESDILSEARSVFADLGDLKTELREEPNQLDAYRAALEMERKSITLYEELLAGATDDEDKNLFQYLIKQEKDHFTVLEELVIHLRQPEQWVESAEFGRRKEY